MDMEALGMPPELAKILADQEAQARMTNADFHHGLDNLLAEASQEHLRTLNRVFRMMARLPKSECQLMAANLEGRAMTHLELRFNVCSGCGKDHDAEFMDEITETVRKAEPQITTEDKSSPVFQEKPAPLPDNSWMDALPTLGSAAPYDELGFTPDQREKMRLYNLDDAYEEGTNRFLGFVCLGCGMIYQSLEDRALRAAGSEGCGGCINKAKFG